MGDHDENAGPDPAALKEYTKLKGGHVCVADTIEELAEQMGVPKDALKKTIDRYNEMCKDKLDEDFSKYPRYMFPIEKAPFYAFKCFLGTDGVFGGVFIDDRCRVKGNDGPVPGLFAAGDVTSGNSVNAYERRSEVINDFTWANASGFLAGESAVSYLKGEL
jgi:succinate dehydrogenase/fumarate reductase flavoprotein subunit